MRLCDLFLISGPLSCVLGLNGNDSFEISPVHLRPDFQTVAGAQNVKIRKFSESQHHFCYISEARRMYWWESAFRADFGMYSQIVTFLKNVLGEYLEDIQVAARVSTTTPVPNADTIAQ